MLGIIVMLSLSVFAVTDDIKQLTGPYNRVSGIYSINGELYVASDVGGEIRTSAVLKLQPDGTLGEFANLPNFYYEAPTGFKKIGDSFVFTVDPIDYYAQLGPMLWLSDGTAAGTRMVFRGWARNPVAYKDHIYFAGDYQGLGNELMRMNSSGEVELVKDIFPGHWPSLMHAPIVYKDKLLFWAYDGQVGQEPFFFDAVTNQLTLLKDIAKPLRSCIVTDKISCDDNFYYHSETQQPSAPFIWNGLLFFMSYPEFGIEPFRTDGTEAGTFALGDIANGHKNSLPSTDKQQWTVFNNELYFRANDLVHGSELWKTRGTPETTQMLKDIQPGVTGSDPKHMIEYKGYLYFQALSGTFGSDDSTGTELWRTDGTPEGTHLFYDFNTAVYRYTLACGSKPNDFIIFNDRLFFTAANFDSQGGLTEALWSTDGTVEGTVKHKQLNEQPGVSVIAHWQDAPNFMTIHNNELYFIANGYAGHKVYRYRPPMPPRFESTPVVEAQVNELYNYEPTAKDPNDDAITYSVVSMPGWMSAFYDGGRLRLTGYPSPTDVGTHQVVVKADANGASTQQSFTIKVTPGITQRTVIARLGAGGDDAMEFQNGQCDPTLDRLELGNKTVALRYTIDLPADAIVQRANLQFTAAWQLNPRAISVQICGERSADAAVLKDGLFDISRRIYSTYTGDGVRSGYKATNARVSWNIPLWKSNEAGAAQTSPDIAAIINELIKQPTWKSGNEIVLCVLHDNFTKAGLRAASYEKDPAQAPRLLMEFTTGQDLSKPVLVEYLGANKPPQMVYGGFGEGVLQCNDRQPAPVFTNVPQALKGMSYLLTARDDKHGIDAQTIYYQLELPLPMRVYALIDVRTSSNIPAWIGADGWSSTAYTFFGDGFGYRAYVKSFDAGEISLKRQASNSSNGISYLFEAVGTTTPLTVTVDAYFADRTYPTIRQGLGNGALQVNDRSVALWNTVPEQLKGLPYLLPSRDDKYAAQSENTAIYRVKLSRAATVYCLIDNRSGDTNPAWLSADGWAAAGMTLMGEDVPYKVFSKNFAAGLVNLKRETGVTTNGTGYAFK
jgi:ELWxxDGT repeat protein